MSTFKFLGISGSLRKASTNSGLLRAAQAAMPEPARLEIADISAIPFFSQDITDVPEAVRKLVAAGDAADGFVFACPEYNYSIAPALKNAIDWMSRTEVKTVFAGKPVAILGSGGGMGTSRAQYHLRQVCVFLDLHPLNKPEVFSNAFAGGFEANGDLKDERIKELVSEQMQALVKLTQKLRG